MTNAGLAVADLPEPVIGALGGLKQQRVRGRIGSADFTSSVMAAGGGRLALSLSKAILTAAGLAVGDTAEVEITGVDDPDTARRKGDASMLDDLEAAALLAIKPPSDDVVLPIGARRIVFTAKEIGEWLERAVDVATAGARATAAVLGLLPLAGVGLAALLGVGPTRLYGSPAALASASAGLVLLGVGLTAVSTWEVIQAW